MINTCSFVHYCKNELGRYVQDRHHNVTHIIIDTSSSAGNNANHTVMNLTDLTDVQRASLYIILSSLFFLLYALIRTRYQGWKKKQFPNALINEASIVGLLGCVIYSILLGYTSMSLAWAISYVALIVGYRITWWLVLYFFIKRIVDGIQTTNGILGNVQCCKANLMRWVLYASVGIVSFFELSWAFGIFVLPDNWKPLAIHIYAIGETSVFCILSLVIIRISFLYIYILKETEKSLSDAAQKTYFEDEIHVPEVVLPTPDVVTSESSARLDARLAAGATSIPKQKNPTITLPPKSSSHQWVFFRMIFLALLGILGMTVTTTLEYFISFPYLVVLDCFRQAFIFFLSMTLPFRSGATTVSLPKHVADTDPKKKKLKSVVSSPKMAPRYRHEDLGATITIDLEDNYQIDGTIPTSLPYEVVQEI